MSESLEQIAMTMIIYGGDAKADAFSALRAARKSDFDEAKTAMSLAEKKISECQKVHLRLLGVDLQFQSVNEQLLISHAMDTMMTAISQIDLIRELIEILKEK